MRHPLVVVLPAVLAVAGVSASSEREVIPEYASWDFVGFSPKLCQGEMPPAELLALADWPLDPDGTGCRTKPQPFTTTASAIPEAEVFDVEPLPALATHADPGAELMTVRIYGQGSLSAASEGADSSSDAFSGRLVADAQLGELRGGFETPLGLTLSFGIERVVHINGELVSSTALTVADLRGLAGGGMPVELPVGTTVGVIQNGPNNVFDAGAMAAGAFATVIQNSLDNQHIQTVTTVNAQVNSVGLLQANRFNDSLRSAVNASMLR